MSTLARGNQVAKASEMPLGGVGKVQRGHPRRPNLPGNQVAT